MLKKIALVACLLVLNMPNTAFAQKGPPRGPTGVIVTPVMVKSFSDDIEALGTTRSNEMVIITADTAEKITAIYFKEGQDVQKGDLLVTLAKGEDAAALRAAQAEYSEALSSYNRAKDLQTTQAISQATLQERSAALKQARAAVAGVSARLDKLAITAPFDGTIGLREVSVGTLVQPSDVITTIDDMNIIKVDFDVPSVYLPTLKKGLKIIGKVEAFGDREFVGEVQTINTQVDPLTRTVKVRAIVPNEDRILKPGLLMMINLAKNNRQAMVIPEEALIKRSNNNFVFLVQDQDGKTIAAQTEIKIGARRTGEIEVLSGLSENDQVVNHGTVKLRDGAEIKIIAVEKESASLDELLKQQQPTQPAKGDDKSNEEKPE